MTKTGDGEVRLSRPCPKGRNDTMSTRLTDAVFFGEHLDTTRPGLTEIPALAAKGDYKASADPRGFKSLLL